MSQGTVIPTAQIIAQPTEQHESTDRL